MTPDEIAEREQRLHAGEPATAAPEMGLRAARPETISLPSEPAANAFRAVVEHAQFGGGDVHGCARGLGVDAEWLDSLIRGRRLTLDAEDLAATCEALQCTPYALWPADVARQTLDAYPPERWPVRTAPLEDLLTSEDSFVARRIEQQAADILSLSAVSQRLEPTEVTVTPYRIDGVLAVHEHTGAVVTKTQLNDLASTRYDYFFTFSQLGAAERTIAYLDRGVLVDAPPPGAGAPPDLVRVANDLATRLPETDAVEVSDGSTTVHWVGRAPGGTVWESWSDPAANFAGDRELIVHGPEEPLGDVGFRLATPALLEVPVGGSPMIEDL